MIDFYTWRTPNGRKVSIALEEMGLEYKVFPIDIGANQQFEADFIKINPNSKIPAIFDREAVNGGFSVFESGAILLYLAEKTGQFLAKSGKKRYDALQWIFFQASGVGPMMGQYNHFQNVAPEKLPYAIARFQKEAERLFQVLDTHFAKVEFLAEDYSIADMMLYPWLVNFKKYTEKAETMPNILRWLNTLSLRPKLQKGMSIPA